VCFTGTDVGGTCLDCSAVSNSNVTTTGTGPTEAVVTFASSAAFSTAVSLVNTNNLSDVHEVFGPAATSSSVVVTGLSPATKYFVVLTPNGCGALPQTTTQDATLNGATAGLALTASGLESSTVSLQNGTNGPEAVLNASSTLSGFVPSLATSPLTVALPSTTLNPPSPVPSYTTTFTALSADLSKATGSFNANGVEAVIPFTATIHLSTTNSLWPNPDLSITSGTLDIQLGFSPFTQEFFVQTVTANLEDHITNCGIGGWCNGIFNALMPNLDQPFAQAVSGALSSLVSTPAVTTAVEQVFAQINTTLKNTPPESVAPGSMFYTATVAPDPDAGTAGSGEFVFKVQWINNAVGTVSTTSN
jgi:hypothetical protein